MTDEPAAGELVVVRRVIGAPRARVFRNWTEPEQLRRWWGPGAFTCPDAQVDLRAGGTYRLVMQAPGGGPLMSVAGTYRTVDPPALLVYTWHEPRTRRHRAAKDPGWMGRLGAAKQILASSDDILGRYHLLDEIRNREEERWVVSDAESGAPEWSARVDLWRSVATNGRQDAAVAWLRMLMADREPTAATAAAVALARWQKPREREEIAVPAALECAREVLPRYTEAYSRHPVEVQPDNG